MSAVRALMRRGVRDLHIVSVPQGGFQVDMLIGAGCVARVEAAAVTLGEYGLAPRFTAAIKAGEIEMWDATCPAIHAGLQAAEKGVPFMPLRGIVGSDLLRVRPDWKVIDNPLAESGTRDPIVILPAIRPDVTLFHALKADSQGNVWIGVQRELMTMAHASQDDPGHCRAHRGRRFPARPGARRRNHSGAICHSHRRSKKRRVAGRARQCLSAQMRRRSANTPQLQQRQMASRAGLPRNRATQCTRDGAARNINCCADTRGSLAPRPSLSSLCRRKSVLNSWASVR